MILRFHIPVYLFVMGQSQESLDVRTNFSHQDLPCSLRVTGGPPLSSEELPEDIRYFGETRQLEFTISEQPPEHTFQSLIEPRNYPELVKLLRSVANRCLRSIRNFGMVPHVHELREPQGEDYERTLRGWDVNVSRDGEHWEAIVTEAEGIGIFMKILHPESQGQEVAELRVARWPEIEEAIQDDLPSLAEKEFTTNAIEHIRLKNFRLAVLESIIGLEIALSRYLAEYLRSYKGTPNERIKAFLSPNFTLTTRLSGILDLTLSPEDLKDVDLRKVRDAVKWRNWVTHRTGHLPPGLSEETIVESISQVTFLTFLLGYRTEQATASPEIRGITKYMQEKHRLLRPSILLLGNHKVLAEFTVVRSPSEAFPIEKLTAAVADLAGRLEARDGKFAPNEHLGVRFFEPPKKLSARWRKGSFELVNSK